MCQGKGSLSHNNREFTAKNIDPSRTADNIVFVQQDLGEAYHRLFNGVIANYNAKQKRNDRKISDYFQHLFNREPSSRLSRVRTSRKVSMKIWFRSARKMILVSALQMRKLLSPV